MPSDKKRINLTVPDEVYQRLQAYMARNGIYQDATACMQLMILRLNAEEGWS